MEQNIRLEDLARLIPVISEAIAASYIESCKVCFNYHQHDTGVAMDVKFVDTDHNVAAHWDGEVDEWMRRAHADDNKRVDGGTCAIALLLISKFTNLVAVEVSRKSNGIDYFLSNPDGDYYDEEHLIFNHTALLEVTGIQTEKGSNTISRRLQIKKDRLIAYKTSKTSKTIDLPTYICVVEFSDPEALVALV